MKEQPFYLQVVFLAPACVTNAVHLDGVLWQALVRMGMRPEEALKEIPLATDPTGRFHLCTAGIPTGSPAIPRTARSRPLVSMHRDAREFVKQPPPPQMSEYPVLGVAEMFFFGVGDVAQVRDLLPAIDGIGRRTRQGFGEVSAGDSLVVPVDLPFLPFTPDGTPSRHLPWDAWEAIRAMEPGLPRPARGPARLLPPYWSADGRVDAALAMPSYVQRDALLAHMNPLKEAV